MRCCICDKLSHPDNPVVSFKHPAPEAGVEDLCRECLEECYPWTKEGDAPRNLWEALLEADDPDGYVGSQEVETALSDEIYPLSVDFT